MSSFAWRSISAASFVCAALLVLPDGVRADDIACPDPGPLYALRDDDAAVMRLLGLSRPRQPRPDVHADLLMGTSRRAWHIDLLRVWPPRDGHCHVAVIRAELLDDVQSEDGPGTYEIESHLVPLELAREPGPPRFVKGPELTRTDWRVLADPEIGDLDGDGVPEIRLHPSVGGVASCWGMTGDECYCIVPSLSQLRIGEGGPALPMSGAHVDAAVLARARAELEGLEPSTLAEACPRYRPRWVHWRAVGHPRFTRLDDGYAIDFAVDRRECAGWLDQDDESLRACRRPTRIFVRHAVRGTNVVTTERPYVATTVSADADDARLIAVPWHFFDGESAPHPISANIGAREGGRVRRTGRGTTGIPLPPGFYLVEVRRGRSRITYQVSVAPEDAPIRLASPATEASP